MGFTDEDWHALFLSFDADDDFNRSHKLWGLAAQAKAWRAVCQELDALVPGWATLHIDRTSGIQRARAALRALAGKGPPDD